MTSISIFATEFETKLKTIHHITLISHRHPDGDALGSLEGMRGLLTKNYPHLAVDVVVPPEESIDTYVSWILGETRTTIPDATDLVLILDTSLLVRTALPVEAFSGYPLLTIDHHEASQDTIPGFRDPTAASTTVLLTEMAQTLQWEIDTHTATALLLGIYSDTGAFIHANSDARALGAASQLLTLGADQSIIAQRAYGNYSHEYLQELGRGLQGITIVDRVAILCLPSDTERGLKTSIISYLSGIENVDIACVLRPDGDMISGSLRTRYQGIDVNKVAQNFGGGGHMKAAGFLIPGSIVDGVIEYNGQKYSVKEFAGLLVSNE